MVEHVVFHELGASNKKKLLKPLKYQKNISHHQGIQCNTVNDQPTSGRFCNVRTPAVNNSQKSCSYTMAKKIKILKKNYIRHTINKIISGRLAKQELGKCLHKLYVKKMWLLLLKIGCRSHDLNSFDYRFFMFILALKFIFV